MNIVQAWQESLELLLPKNLVPFLQVVAKTALTVYRSLLVYFWWFILAGAVGLLTHPHIILFIIWLLFWILFIILAARPSVLLKDLKYYESNLLYGLPLLVLLFVPCCFPRMLIVLFAPYLVIAMFFLCDTNAKPYQLLCAPLRALKMAFLTLPLYLLIVLVLYGTNRYFCCTNVGPLLGTIFIIIPLTIVVISRLYVLHIHRHYKDYFEGCW